jgi:phosphopentomutase
VTAFRRILFIVLDGVGVGEAPDAARWGDTGSNSIGNVARAVGGLRVPNLERMGLGNVVEAPGVAPNASALAHYGRMKPAAAGKDSTIGHWELMGCVVSSPLPVYPAGFPPGVMDAFERAIGRGSLGNRPASGTAIIQELGDEHVATGAPIVYTSQDSVFQVAAHEDVIATEALYLICEKARQLLAGEHAVGRVIARPFAGRSGQYHRTPLRRDFSLAPPERTVLDLLVDAGRNVHTIGKIDELFAGRGITRSEHTRDNHDGMARTLAALDGDAQFVFANLVDFDTMWGHRNDARAYALGLEDFDSFLAGLFPRLGEGDLLVVTSDHGNDPTTQSTDHSREYVPVIAWHSAMSRGTDLGTRATLADAGATVADALGVPAPGSGTSFLERL